MRSFRAVTAAFLILGVAAFAMPAPAMAKEVAFTQEYLDNPDNIAVGKKVFKKRCKFCHGKSAYPGKAPKLKPIKYTPEFVYKRVTKGFKGMPSFKAEFNKKQRRGVAAYIMSKEFSN